jgi:hypothetical protein
MEAPIMFGISILAARWVLQHLQVSPLRSRRLAMGCIALGLMLVAEFTLGLWIRGVTIRGYFAARDPVSGAAYYLTLGAFAVVGLVRVPYPSKPDPVEVAEVFEVPLAFILDRANHRRDSREFKGRHRVFYVLPYQGRYIWGATAGMLVNLAEVLTA